MFSKFIKKLFGKAEEESEFTNQDNEDLQNEDGQDDEQFINFDTLHKQTMVWLESAYRHQYFVFRRSTQNDRIGLGEILNKLFKMQRSSVSSLAVMFRSERSDDPLSETIIDTIDEIWNFDVFSCMLRHKTEDGYYTLGMTNEMVLVVKSSERNIILALNSLGGVDTVKYLRVTILSPDNSPIDDCHSFKDKEVFKTKNAPVAISFILSYNEVDKNPEFDYFDKVEKSSNDKLKTDRYLEVDKIEEEYVHGIFEFRPDYYFGYGRYLYNQNRYYDTYVTFERAYNYLKEERLDDGGEKYLSTYYEVCFLMGMCLSKLDREDEAAYYYKQAAPSYSLEKPNYLALCHARLGNPISQKQMHDWLVMVAGKYGSHENWSEEVKQFSVDVPVALSVYKKKMDDYFATNPSYDDKITIGFVLKALFGTKKKNLLSPLCIYDLADNQFLSRIEDVQEILDYVLNKKNASNKVFVLSCTHALSVLEGEEDKSILCHSTPLVITTHSIKAEESSAIIRVDIVRSNFQSNDDKRKREDINTPLFATFCLGSSSGLDYATDKDSLLTAVRKAIEFIDEKRFMESFKLAKWVHECCSNQLKSESGVVFESEDDMLWAIYFESAYDVGYCLMEMGNIKTASYYLELARHSMNYKHIQEYINFLSNTKDYQALEVVEEVIENSPKPKDDNNLQAWEYHMAFLKRRKAYILIDKKRFAEARELLKEMLNDPLCRDFASGELRYVDSIECH